MPDDRKPDLVVALSTAGSPEEARRIASALVAEQLAACINVVDDVHSIYRRTERSCSRSTLQETVSGFLSGNGEPEEIAPIALTSELLPG